MRRFFSANRVTSPPGPPHGTSGGRDNMIDTNNPPQETLQAVRQRQREKQRRYVMQMMRAEKERDIAHDAGEMERAAMAEVQRRQMSDAADAFAQQIMIIERIMEEFGLTLDLEEEAKLDREMLEESRVVYDQHLADLNHAIADSKNTSEFIKTSTSSYMMPSEVYDEDEAMRELDEIAKQTGRV